MGIKEGLYLAPETHDTLYIERSGNQLSFLAWWFKVADLSGTADLTGNEAKFSCVDHGSGNTISGVLRFTNPSKVSLITDQEFAFSRQTDYIWLRTDMWKLSDDQLSSIAHDLNIPENLNVQYRQSEPVYEDGESRYTTYVQIYNNGSEIAHASVDSINGKMLENIQLYSKIDQKALARSLGLPDDVNVTVEQGEAYYWDAGQLYVTSVEFKENGHMVGQR